METPSSSKSSKKTQKYLLALLKQESILEKFEAEQLEFESNHDEKTKMRFPDLYVKGVHQKKFEATGGETVVSLDQLHVRKLFKFIDLRSHFRLGFVRIVWIPSATELPGIVTVGIKDLRRVEGQQDVDKKTSNADRIFHFTYMQDVYVHKKELSKIAIFVNLTGFEAKYKKDSILGCFRVFWLINNTNVPTQHQMVESTITVPQLERMPTVKFMKERASTSQQIDFERKEIEQEISPIPSVLNIGNANIDDINVHEKMKEEIVLTTTKSEASTSSATPKFITFSAVDVSEAKEDNSWDFEETL